MTCSDTYTTKLEESFTRLQARTARLEKIHFIPGREMLSTQYPEPRYLWLDKLPDAGLSVLAAPKAAGKTLLLLQMADAISRGEPFLGVPTIPSKTLFVELELSQRRTAQRLAKMGIVPGENLHFAFAWPTGDEGLQALADSAEEHGYRFIVVDVMQLLWPMGADTNSYQDSYSVLAPLRHLANRLNAMILLVTHKRKSVADDYVAEVIGSTGIVANSDVVLTLTRQRGENDAVLHIDGNDVESSKIALKFETDPLGFQPSNVDPELARQTPERKAIVQAIKDLGGKGRTSQIAAALGKGVKDISMLLGRLKDQGVIVSSGYGEYALNIPIGSVGTVGTLSMAVGTSNTSNTSNGTSRGEVVDWPMQALPDNSLEDDNSFDLF